MNLAILNWFVSISQFYFCNFLLNLCSLKLSLSPAFLFLFLLINFFFHRYFTILAVGICDFYASIKAFILKSGIFWTFTVGTLWLLLTYFLIFPAKPCEEKKKLSQKLNIFIHHVTAALNSLLVLNQLKTHLKTGGPFKLNSPTDDCTLKMCNNAE